MRTALLMIAMAIVTGHVLAKDWNYEVTDTLTFNENSSGLNLLSGHSINGGFNFTAAAGTDIRVLAIRTIRAENEAKAEAFRGVFIPTVEREGSILKIGSEDEDNDFEKYDAYDHSTISFEVYAPAEMNIEANTVNGGVDIFGMTGNIEVNSVNGGVEMTALNHLVSDVNINTVNGGISTTIKELDGDSNFNTVNGGVDVTVTGDLMGDVSVGTVNGSASLAIPKDASFRLTAETGFSGAVMTDWGGAHGSSDETTYRLSINGGKHDIKMSTMNGSISLGKSMNQAD